MPECILYAFYKLTVDLGLMALGLATVLFVVTILLGFIRRTKEAKKLRLQIFLVWFVILLVEALTYIFGYLPLLDKCA